MKAPSQEEFDATLCTILDEHPASALLAVPGVYEVVSEFYNNDVLTIIQDRRAEVGE